MGSRTTAIRTMYALRTTIAPQLVSSLRRRGGGVPTSASIARRPFGTPAAASSADAPIEESSNVQQPGAKRARPTRPKKGHSGLQKQVLKLYRDILTAAREKSPEGRASIVTETRAKFKANMSIPKREFGKIEHLLRMGGKQLKTVQMKGFDGINAR